MKAEKAFTKQQNLLLEEAGFRSLYDLITYPPISLNVKKRFVGEIEEKTLYCSPCYITDYTILGGGRPKVRITIRTPEQTIQGYSFLPFRFLAKALNSKEAQYVQMSVHNGFYQFHTFSQSDPLGGLSQVFEANYQKLGPLTAAKLRMIHTRLPPTSYLLSLAGLLPNTLGISENFSLYQLHHPTSPASFYETKKQWQLFQAFLRLMEVRYFQEQSLTGNARGSALSPEIINSVITSHPYQLSPSQLNAILTLTRGLSETNN